MSRRRLNLPVAEIVDEYARGASAVSLANKYDTTTSTIIRRLRNEGVAVRSNNQIRRDDLPSDEIVAAYVAGKTSASLAEKYSSSTATILRRVREAGVPVRPKGSKKKRRRVEPEKLSDLIEAYLGGATLEEAASIAGWTTREAARLYLKEAGVPTRSQGEAFRIAAGKGRIRWLRK